MQASPASWGARRWKERRRYGGCMWLGKTSADEPRRQRHLRVSQGKGELGSMNRNGWCRRPVNTNMRNRIGKGSTRVVDAINGSGAVWEGMAACRLSWVKGMDPKGSHHLRPERRSSIRQEKDTLRVVFCASKGHEATGHARGSGLHL